MPIKNNGADITAREIQNRTPYDVAIANGHEKTAEILKKAEQSQFTMFETNANSIILSFNDWKKNLKNSVKNGDAMSAEYLLKEIQDMELLHLAADKGDVNLVKMLLQNGFQIDAKDAELGWSPLLRATKLGHVEMVKFLLENGANINSKSWNNVTSLHLATAWNRVDIAKILIENNADVTAVDDILITPLHNVAMGEFLEEEAELSYVAELLIQHGANVNAIDAVYKETPLHKTVYRGNTYVAQILIEEGANITARNFENRTPYDIAIENGLKRIAKILKEAEYRRKGAHFH